MASVHTAEEALSAQRRGWRTFRTRDKRNPEPLTAREFECPASKEQGFRLQCVDCGACNGRRSVRDLRGNVAIMEH